MANNRDNGMKIVLSNKRVINNVRFINDVNEFSKYYKINLEEAKNIAADVDRYYRKEKIQREIGKKYGVDGDLTSSCLSISGKIGDSTALLIDNLVQDLLSVEASNTTNYSKKRIQLFDELHGEGSWAKALEFATQWHQGRVSKQITMPFDDKGMAEVVQESAELGGFVKQLIVQMNNK